jgi:hypothetical protein
MEIWKILSNPKDLGGWRLKDTSFFGQALVEKSLWVFFTKENFWR